MRLLLALAIALGTLFIVAQAGTLYAELTDFSKNRTEVLQHIVSIDENSGEVTRLVKCFEVATDSVTYSDISACEPRLREEINTTDFFQLRREAWSLLLRA